MRKDIEFYSEGSLIKGHLGVVDDNSSSLDEKKRLTQRQEIISVSSQVHQL
jgi:hypothetical protein